MKVKLVIFVPIENSDEVREAIGAAGAGIIGEYSFCSFSVSGTGRFIPSDNANPHIGEPGKFEAVQEERVEVVCERSGAKAVLAAIRKVHPYEEVAFDIYPLIDENEL
jgi:hypothetical protein